MAGLDSGHIYLGFGNLIFQEAYQDVGVWVLHHQRSVDSAVET